VWTSIGPDGGVEPFFAERFSTSEDGRIASFVPRDDVLFHDGTPMDAAAVAVNVLRVRDKLRGGWLAGAMKKMTRLGLR
jgi:ABC-type transport system substrate-binding protein